MCARARTSIRSTDIRHTIRRPGLCIILHVCFVFAIGHCARLSCNSEWPLKVPSAIFAHAAFRLEVHSTYPTRVLCVCVCGAINRNIANIFKSIETTCRSSMAMVYYHYHSAMIGCVAICVLCRCQQRIYMQFWYIYMVQISTTTKKIINNYGIVEIFNEHLNDNQTNLSLLIARFWAIYFLSMLFMPLEFDVCVMCACKLCSHAYERRRSNFGIEADCDSSGIPFNLAERKKELLFVHSNV